jgi:pimeloyl-ACP methyl ester carboxylesterase
MPERVVIFNDRQLRLVADIYAGRRKGSAGKRMAILVPGLTHHRPDPEGDLYAPRLTAMGFDVCAFDPSGCGESDDDQITIRKHIADLHSILSHFRSQGYEEIGVIGFSFGGLIAIWSWDEWVKAMVLVAPVTQVNPEPLSRFTAEELQDYDTRGIITIRKPAGSLRERVILDRGWVEERKTLNYQAALEQVRCPPSLRVTG